MLAENAWSADSEWGGVKALCGAAQECTRIRNTSLRLGSSGDIYWTAPSTLRSTFNAPNLSHSLCLRFPHTSALGARTYAMLASYHGGIRSGHHKALAA